MEPRMHSHLQLGGVLFITQRCGCIVSLSYAVIFLATFNYICLSDSSKWSVISSVDVSGQLTMAGNLTPGVYTLQIRVVDSKFSSTPATSTVYVNVIYVNDTGVKSTGSLRLSGRSNTLGQYRCLIFFLNLENLIFWHHSSQLFIDDK